MSRYLHIVAFDNPYPPDYGGALDVFYKMKSLHEAGVKVILHLYTYGRNQTKPLEPFTEKIYIYPRNKSFFRLLSSRPFIVNTRLDDGLSENLKKDDHPVLFEGVHTTGQAGKLRERQLFLRAHNIEAEYYAQLARAEKNLLKKIYFYTEARKLEAFEKKIVREMDGIFSVHPDEARFFRRLHPVAEWIPVFHPFEKVALSETTEDFVLFHGNLSVAENIAAVRYLWHEVMRGLPYRFVVAGKNPPNELVRMAHRQGFVLEPNPSDRRLSELIKNARVHLLYTEQKTGIKLKLLNVLFNGKEVIVNDKMVSRTRLEPLVQIARSAREMQERIKEAFQKNNFDFRSVMLQREQILSEYYNNRKNAEKLVKHVF